MTDEEKTLFEQIGGAPTLRRLVDRFYDRIAQDPELRAMFPDDLEPGKEWQYLFLTHVFGGPGDYFAVRGHPRLRMRHAPFAIGRKARDSWLGHMLTAMDEIGIEESAAEAMRAYFERGSEFLINVYDDESE